MPQYPDCMNYENIKISRSIDRALVDLRSIMGNTMDLNIMEVQVSGHRCAVVTIENMTSTETMAQLLFRPLTELRLSDDSKPQEVVDFLTKHSLMSSERKTCYNYGDAVTQLFSGFALVLVDGIASGQLYGIQGYDKRSIDEPTSDLDVFGGKDGFIEVIRTNVSLVRRRLKTPCLRFELMQAGTKSKTDICIAYMADRCSPELIDSVRKRLSSIKLETVFSSGYVMPYLAKSSKSIFTDVQTTDRPDTFAAKLCEGKVGVLIDGTPFTLLIPSFFIESFNTMDDYATRPFYATYIRFVKYLSFMLAVMLPGVYVALATFHSETFSHKLLLHLVVSEETTPYPLVFEVVLITLMYEILKEAGIRLPKTVGGAVSIVGGLIIGDAAVNSGLVSAPILIIIGLTATSSFVIPSLNQQTSLLRMIMIIAGGVAGLYGISLITAALLANACALSDNGIPYTAPVSPFFERGFKDILMRIGFKKLEKTQTLVTDFKAETDNKSDMGE